MRWTMLVLLAGVCAGLGGCATAGHTIPTSPAVGLASDDVDAEKVATVNQWAQTHGATVVWINYPTRAHPRSSSSGGGD
jgi:hypothetical protein